MQEPFDNIQKVWALKSIVSAATVKSQEIFKENDTDSKNSMLSLMMIVSDATEKLSHMRWTDSFGLQRGVAVYLQAIKNI